jgi:hypothetical protein
MKSEKAVGISRLTEIHNFVEILSCSQSHEQNKVIMASQISLDPLPEITV